MLYHHLWLGVLAASSLLSVVSGSGLVRRQSAKGKNGAVTSASNLCTLEGIKILRKGGSAADAMVTTTLCIGTVTPYHSGIGGGGFALIQPPRGAPQCIDFREAAPAAATQGMFGDDENLSKVGGLASGVPGELRGLERLHAKYGRLKWPELVDPIVKLARNGFPVTEELERMLSLTQVASSPQPLGPWEDFSGSLRPGDKLTRKTFAQTLEVIRDRGANAFYSGEIAQETIRTVQAAQGIMTLDDLKKYSVIDRPVAKVKYRGYTINSCSAPSSGVVVANIFNTLGDLEKPDDDLALATHRLDEAFKYAYGLRTQLGDASTEPSVKSLQEQMTNPTLGAKIRQRIGLTALDSEAYNPKGLEIVTSPGTSHINVIDRDGLAISLTTTINLPFGSRVMTGNGIILNNEMDDFSSPSFSNAFGFIPSPSNFIKAGKRPMSSMSPTIVTRPCGSGSCVALLVGSAGGSRIITTVAQFIWNVIYRGMSVNQAVAAPRMHDQLTPETVSFEYNYDPAIVERMRDVHGHKVEFTKQNTPFRSTGNAIGVADDGTYEPAREPRQKDSGGWAI